MWKRGKNLAKRTYGLFLLLNVREANKISKEVRPILNYKLKLRKGLLHLFLFFLLVFSELCLQ